MYIDTLVLWEQAEKLNRVNRSLLQIIDGLDARLRDICYCGTDFEECIIPLKKEQKALELWQIQVSNMIHILHTMIENYERAEDRHCKPEGGIPFAARRSGRYSIERGKWI